MDYEKTMQDYLTLSDEAQKQVADFIMCLKQIDVNRDKAVSSSIEGISVESFVGMWRDRQDLADSEKWVRKVRKKEWCQEVVSDDNG